MPTGEEIRQAIEQLAAALGVAAEYVWEVMYRQEYLVNGWMILCLGLVLIVVGMWRFSCLQKNWKESPDGYQGCSTSTSMAQDLRRVFNGFSGLGGVVAGSVGVLSGLAHIINPGYYVIKSIAGLF